MEFIRVGNAFIPEAQICAVRVRRLGADSKIVAVFTAGGAFEATHGDAYEVLDNLGLGILLEEE